MTQRTLVGCAIALVLALSMVGTVYAEGWVGYHKNLIFVGTAQQWCFQKYGWDAATCANFMAPFSINEKIVMKWNEQWDKCNAHGYDDPTNCLGAWTNNEWNGNVADGSGFVWHYKIIWVGGLGESSPYWKVGGYSIWGNYEVIQDMGVDPAVGHTWFAKATPNGYGGL